MSTLIVSDIPLGADTPAQRLRRTAAAVRVSLHWWGVHRALSLHHQKEEVSAGYAADVRFLTAGKKILDVRHEALRKLTAIRTRLVSYWRGLTLPFTEPGVRLLRQSDVEAFVHTMQGFREELTQAEADLNAVYEELKADAQRRLGRLFDAADYPPQVRDLFGVDWDFPAVEPPGYLMRISPELYEEERRRVAARFDEAVRLAEQAFASEFAKLLAHLTERLGAAETGERRVFRDTCVSNLTEFFEKFRHLNVRSNAELDGLVDQAQRLVQGSGRKPCATTPACGSGSPTRWPRCKPRWKPSSSSSRGAVSSGPGLRSMEPTMQLRIDAHGQVQCLYDERIDLAALGLLTIRRASQVEPDAAGQWWADLAPSGGPRLGPFPRHSQALEAERHWLERDLMACPTRASLR